jgi:hypothetical protein
MANLDNGNIKVYSTVRCPDCNRAKKFFIEQRILSIGVFRRVTLSL